MNVWLQPRERLFIIRHMRPFKLSPPPPLRERDVISACLDLLRYKGYFPIRVHSGLFKTLDGRILRMGEPGIPDYACVHERYPGFLLETKRPGKVPTPDQEKKAQEIRLGYHLAVAAADDVAALARWIDKHESNYNNERLPQLCHPPLATATATETGTMKTDSSIRPPKS